MELKEKAIFIIKKLVREGHIAYFAGGYVRDLIMDHPSSDIDIATSATPDQILDLFEYTIPVGLAFGVVVVVIEGHSFEVSTFRKDVLYLNGRQPESIELSNAKEDATRRDFTINGLFYDPLDDKIYDYVGGKEDIKNGIIRAIGNAGERFFEDRLRMIRAVRFAAKFGFHIEQETENGIFENARMLFPAVAMERILQEFNKMQESESFSHAIIDLHRLSLLPVIFPVLEHVHLNTIKAQVKPFPFFPKNAPVIIYLMELFPGFSLNEFLDLCFYLKINNKNTKLVSFYYNYKNLILKPEEMDSVDLAHFYANSDSSLVLQLVAAKLVKQDAQKFLEWHQKKSDSLRLHIERIAKKKPLVSGTILSEHGISEGKKMGALLKEAVNLSILHDLNDAESVIALLKKLPNWEK